MSDYSRAAWHPVENVVRMACYLDNYFGQHRYGVRFPDDVIVYRPEDVEIPYGYVWIPVKVDEGEHGLYYGTDENMPALLATGKTIPELVKDIRKAIRDLIKVGASLG